MDLTKKTKQTNNRGMQRHSSKQQQKKHQSGSINQNISHSLVKKGSTVFLDVSLIMSNVKLDFKTF